MHMQVHDCIDVQPSIRHALYRAMKTASPAPTTLDTAIDNLTDASCRMRELTERTHSLFRTHAYHLDHAEQALEAAEERRPLAAGNRQQVLKRAA
jgi:hypothetical protein